MGEAKQRRLAVAQGHQDPGPSAPRPTTPRWGERAQLEATLVAQHLDDGKPIGALPPTLHQMAGKLLRLARKTRET